MSWTTKPEFYFPLSVQRFPRYRIANSLIFAKKKMTRVVADRESSIFHHPLAWFQKTEHLLKGDIVENLNMALSIISDIF